jgi:hypothetical protein
MAWFSQSIRILRRFGQTMIQRKNSKWQINSSFTRQLLLKTFNTQPDLLNDCYMITMKHLLQGTVPFDERKRSHSIQFQISSERKADLLFDV